MSIRAREPASALLEEAGVDVRHLGRNPFDPRVTLDLLRLIRTRKISVLHTHGYAASNHGRIAARLAGVPVVVHEHFIDDGIPGYQKLIDLLLAPATCCGIGVSAAVARFMRRQRRIPRDHLLVLNGGVPIHTFRRGSPEAGYALREQLGIARDATVVGVIGRLAHVKGLDIMLLAWAGIVTRHAAARLLIVGDGPERAELEQQAASLGVADSVIFAGHHSDIPECLAAIDLAVVPSRSEGFPMALIEQMAAGLPVVAAAVGGIPEIISDGINGVLVPPENPAELAAAVSRLLDDPVRSRTLADCAAKSVEQFDVEHYAGSLALLYNHLIAAGRGIIGVRWLLQALHLAEREFAILPGFRRGGD